MLIIDVINQYLWIVKMHFMHRKDILIHLVTRVPKTNTNYIINYVYQNDT